MDERVSERARLFDQLTTREFDVLKLLAEGLSDREIADRLTVAYTTIKWYNRQIFNKLGVENRRQAIRRAQELRLLESPETTVPQPVFSSLPAETTPFVGRQRERNDLAQLLRGQVRLVTILAQGGMGKTRLALAAAQSASAQFPNGMVFVSLAPLTSADQIVSAITEALNFRLIAESRSPQQQLIDYLREKSVLLILDNFEHLLDGAPLVMDILQAAQGVVVLVTSRERLRLSGETVYTLGGMAYAEQFDSESILNFSAVQLFDQSARRSRPDFTVAEDPQNVVKICQLVQGMPLALELAAAWVGALSLAEIAEEITANLDFLETQMRDIPERLRSVRAVFESTWKRLSAEEQDAFCKLSVFRGGCTRQAAQTVTGATLETLTGLVNKALLRRIPDSGRYEVHELLRQYAKQQLELEGKAEAVKNAHALCFANDVQLWGRALKGPRQGEAAITIEADIQNIRDAFRHSIIQGNLELCNVFTSLWFFYEIKGGYAEATELFGAAINKFAYPDSAALGKFLAVQGHFMHRLGKLKESEEFCQRAITLLRLHGEPAEIVIALATLGNVKRRLDTISFDDEDQLYEEALQIGERYQDQWAIAVALYLRGFVKMLTQSYGEAEAFFRQALTIEQSNGDLWNQTFTLRDLAGLAFERQDYAKARQLYEDALHVAQKLNMPLNISANLAGLGDVSLAESRLVEAMHLFEESLRIRRNIGVPIGWQIINLGRVAQQMGNYPEAYQYFIQAIKTAYVSGDLNSIPYFLVRLALLFDAQAAGEEAVRLCVVAQRLLISDLEEQSHIHDILNKLHSELPPDTYRAAVERGNALKLDDVVAELLAEEQN